MTKFCEVCRQMMKCNYCIKYGTNGVYLYLEEFRRRAKQNVRNLDLDKLQLQSLGNSRKHRS